MTGYTPDGARHVAARPVEVVDTVGAGDTFNAGLLAGLHDAGLLQPGLPRLTAETLRRRAGPGRARGGGDGSARGRQPPERNEL